MAREQERVKFRRRKGNFPEMDSYIMLGQKKESASKTIVN